MENPPRRTIDEIIVNQLFDGLSRTLTEIKATPTSNAKHEQWVEMYGVAKELFEAMKEHIAISSEAVREFENGEHVEFLGMLCMVHNAVSASSPLQYQIEKLGKDKAPSGTYLMHICKADKDNEYGLVPAAPLDQYELVDSAGLGWTWRRKTGAAETK